MLLVAMVMVVVAMVMVVVAMLVPMRRVSLSAADGTVLGRAVLVAVLMLVVVVVVTVVVVMVARLKCAGAGWEIALSETAPCGACS